MVCRFVEEVTQYILNRNSENTDKVRIMQKHEESAFKDNLDNVQNDQRFILFLSDLQKRLILGKRATTQFSFSLKRLANNMKKSEIK